MTILSVWGVPASSFHRVSHSDDPHGMLGTLHPLPITLLRRVLIHFVESLLNIVHFHIQVKNHSLIHLNEK